MPRIATKSVKYKCFILKRCNSKMLINEHSIEEIHSLLSAHREKNCTDDMVS